MRLSAPIFARATLLAALAAPLFTLGCTPTGAGRGPAVPGAEGAITPDAVPDATFASSLHKVLRDGAPSGPRLRLLAGVVQRQLAHAAARFGGGHDVRATESVYGALYLLRVGEGRKEMLAEGAADRALAGAIERVSTRGDEGRALALMKMRAAALPAGAPARGMIEQHLAALDAWTRDTHTGSAILRAGADERAKVARALLEPDGRVIEEAAAAIEAWVEAALRYQEDLHQSGKLPTREEAIEAQRALSSGGATMIGLFLRYGDVEGARKHLDGPSMERVVVPALRDRLRDAAGSDEAQARAFRALAFAFAQKDPDESSPETDVDEDLIAAAIFGSSLEAYRRDPKNFDIAMLLARSLVRFGMPEAAPLVVAEALAARPSPTTASASMALLLSSVAESAEADDLDAALRTFSAAGPLLALADKPELRGRLDPSPARVRFITASIYIRAGNLGEARSLLKAAVAAEPSVSGLTTLAIVERQAGNAKAAEEAIEQATRAPDARVSPVDLAEAHLIAFELLRDASAPPERIQRALDAALTAALAARKSAGNNVPAKTRAERILGHVLEAYGDSKGGARAFDRAIEAAAADRSSLGAAMLDAIGRALVRRDLVAARAALKRGLEGNVSDDDLTYGGLWVSLLERGLGAPTDGTAERALRTSGKSTWTAKLAAWSSGKLSDADLGAAAQSAAQRVEAAFYTAMGRKAAGDPAAEQRLRDVARAPLVDLLEVQIARELVAPPVRASLPGDVRLP